jgi:O-antigen ligase
MLSRAFSRVCATALFSETTLKRIWIPLCVVSALFVIVAASFWVFLPQDLATPGILTKTFDELEQGRTDGRAVIFSAAIDRIINDGETFLLGRGLGMFPIDMGYHAPDWLLAAKAVSMYPHNIVIEAQYELGILGTVLIVYMILRPLAIFRSKPRNYDTKIIACLYVFFFILSMVSGSLAYSYSLLFVLGMFWGRLYASKNLAASDTTPDGFRVTR